MTKKTHREKFKKAFKVCRAKGVKPFTKEFGKCMKKEMAKMS